MTLLVGFDPFDFTMVKKCFLRLKLNFRWRFIWNPKPMKALSAMAYMQENQSSQNCNYEYRAGLYDHSLMFAQCTMHMYCKYFICFFSCHFYHIQVSISWSIELVNQNMVWLNVRVNVGKSERANPQADQASQAP